MSDKAKSEKIMKYEKPVLTSLITDVSFGGVCVFGRYGGGVCIFGKYGGRT